MSAKATAIDSSLRSTPETLSRAAQSLDHAVRLRVGEVVSALVRRGTTIERRVKELRVRDLQKFERLAEVDLVLNVARSVATASHIALNFAFVGVAPKSLFYDLKIQTGYGTNVSLASREVDSRLAQSFLVPLAIREGLTMPSVPVWDWSCGHAGG